jgi:hypothetical protein
MSRNQRASSVFVVSDLHLGGQAPAMMGHVRVAEVREMASSARGGEDR